MQSVIHISPDLDRPGYLPYPTKVVSVVVTDDQEIDLADAESPKSGRRFWPPAGINQDGESASANKSGVALPNIEESKLNVLSRKAGCSVRNKRR